MKDSPIQPGQLLTGSLFNEPMRVETVASNGPDSWALGLVGTHSEKFRKVTLTAHDLKSLTIQDTTKSYDGDGQLLRLGKLVSVHAPLGASCHPTSARAHEQRRLRLREPKPLEDSSTLPEEWY